MANKGNGLPQHLYKKMLTESYLQNKKDEISIKNNLMKNHNPILQKDDRYIPPATRGNILVEEYNKKMSEKPEKKHIKKITLLNNLTSGVKVIAENKRKEGIKMNPKIRKNQDSFQISLAHKNSKAYQKQPDTFKNFYLDSFNSVNQNQSKNKNVSNYIIFN